MCIEGGFCMSESAQDTIDVDGRKFSRRKTASWCTPINQSTGEPVQIQNIENPRYIARCDIGQPAGMLVVACLFHVTVQIGACGPRMRSCS